MAVGVGPELPVGTIIYSILSAATMLSEHGNMWVLADGQSVAGSRYAQLVGSSVPDLRGAFLRGKGATYNPDGDLPVGTYTADKLASHSHTQGNIAIGSFGGGSPTGSYGYLTASSGGTPGATGNINISINATGSNETAPKSITMYIYIKVN